MWPLRRMRALVVLAFAGLIGLGDAARAEQGKPLVVSSIRPLHLIVLAFAGERLDARVLLDADVSPHDFALRPSQLRLLASAQQLFWIGPTMEHQLPGLMERLGAMVPNTPLLAMVGAPARGDGFVDPHIWLDPRLATSSARAMARVLAERGLLDARETEPGLQAFSAAMDLTERRIRAELHGLEGVPFVAMHDGYAHFVQRFGLNQVRVLALDAEQQVGARALARMRALVRDSGAVCLLREGAGSERLAQAIAAGTAMRVLALDSLAGAQPDDSRAYARFLEQFAHAIAGCLRGPAS